MGSPVDDALDRLEHFLANGDPMVDIATVRSALEQLREERDEWQHVSRETADNLHAAIRRREQRAEAAEAEVQQLREGLDRLADAAEVFVPDERYVDEQGDDLERAVIEARALLAASPDGGTYDDTIIEPIQKRGGYQPTGPVRPRPPDGERA